MDVLLPRTDAGVLFQLIVVATVFPPAIYASWRNKEVRLFVIGLFVFVLGLMALRTVH